MNVDFFKQDACYINGNWVADAPQSIPVHNPATGEMLGSVPKFGRAETAQAIQAAQDALPTWRGLTAEIRANYLHKMADLIAENLDDLAQLLTLEMGKALAEAKGEITGCVKYMRWFAEEGKRCYGDVIPSPIPTRRILVLKEPVGVVAAITPWNFPNLMLGRKLAAAWAAGCTVVCKPASATPYSAIAFGKIAEMAGLPKGVLNIVTGSAQAIADEMTENPLVKKITFTGSTEIGKELAQKAMIGLKKISLELGGNAPFIVFEDADIDAAVQGAMASKFRNSGQTCVCANRLYVHDNVYDVFTKKFTAEVEKLKLGNGLEQGTEQGPLIDIAGVQKVEEHLADAIEKGAILQTGGKRAAQGGSFFEPTVLTEVTHAMKVAKEETFGPLAPIFRFHSEAEVIEKANDTEYGLACYCYTQNLARTFRLLESLEYGQVGINEGVITTEVAPFGGIKESGFGREGSKYGLEDYLNIKYGAIGGLG